MTATPLTAEQREVLATCDTVWPTIHGECMRQLQIWDVTDHAPQTWVGILAEQLGQAASAALVPEPTPEHILEYERQLIHLAAVAVSAIENLWRFRAPSGPWLGADGRPEGERRQ